MRASSEATRRVRTGQKVLQVLPIVVGVSVFGVACIGEGEVVVTNNCEVDVEFAAAGGVNSGDDWHHAGVGQKVVAGRYPEETLHITVIADGEERVWGPTEVNFATLPTYGQLDIAEVGLCP